ncbi:MAG: hemerythrin domain-containing protein, partial [Pseudogulbenkiania sp.]|nr:hemerythrin domain-containing protein [Pseudogulbenkiania sp.]
QRLRRACLDGDAAARTALLEIFRLQYAAPLEQHFRHEETWLLPHLDEGMGARLLAEHQELRELAADPSGNPSRLAEALITHVRFEERELFPWLEQNLSAKQLGALRMEPGQA